MQSKIFYQQISAFKTDEIELNKIPVIQESLLLNKILVMQESLSMIVFDILIVQAQ